MPRKQHPVPLPQTPESATKVYDLTEQSIPAGVKSVLMLEDDVDFAEILRLFLESHSYQVTCVTNGVDGLRQVMAKDFDIILCDLLMPNLPGDMFHLAVERAKNHLCKRFIFMTGYKADPKWINFLSRIKSPVLGKPFALSDVLSTIQTVLTENALTN
jgi:DNA-binding response OmpR family regulator